MKKHLPFVLAIAVLVCVLGGFVFYQHSIVSGGTVVTLETRPVDPRDLLRGEYVILWYAIENDEIVRDAIQKNDTKVYIRLEQKEGVAKVVEATTEYPDMSGAVWLTGEVQNGRVRFPDLEQYYVPEGAGKLIERMRSGLHVDVAINNGRARVVGLRNADLEPISAGDYIQQ